MIMKLVSVCVNDKKINKPTYKMFSLFNTRMGALEDAYNTLNKIKKSTEVKTVKKIRNPLSQSRCQTHAFVEKAYFK